MPKRNIPNYRLHKASGQAVVELDGRTFYLGKHGSKASREEYERRIAEYLANGRQLPPTCVNTGVSCQELAIYYLEWAEKHHIKQPKSFRHCKRAMSFLVEHYGKISADEFSARSLLYLQDKIVNAPNERNGKPLTRKTVNRYIGLIKQAFKHGAKYGFVSPSTHHALQVVDQLRKGHTSAPDNPSVKPVDPDVFERTLPHLPKRVADMCRVQRLCAMRPQDVCNLRACDIDRSGDVWLYRPPGHKTAHLGDVLTKYIGAAAQAILTPYLIEKADNPEAFLFSPTDTVRDRSIEKRRNRKNLSKKGEVQPSHQNRRKSNPKRAPGEQYSTDSYGRAVTRACKRAGVPPWSVNQLRHRAASDIRKKHGLEAAQVMCGHKRASTTEIYAEVDIEKAVKVAREMV